mgnify:CR=1 FL=1
MPNTKEAAVTEPAEKPAKKRGANKAAADAPRKRTSSKAASRTKETAPEVKTAADGWNLPPRRAFLRGFSKRDRPQSDCIWGRILV